MTLIKNFLQSNSFGLLSLFVTPVLAWFFNRRKEFSELKKNEAEATSLLANSSGNLAISWEKFAEKMEMEYNECRETTAKLQISIDNYKDTTEQLDRKVNIVTSHNNELEERVNQSTLKNAQLQYDLDNFKVENNKLKLYTEKLVNFIENLLDQIGKIDAVKAQESVKELENIKNQFKGDINGKTATTENN